MTKETETNIIELYDAAEDKNKQIKLMVDLKYGTESEILKVLHDHNRAWDIKTKRGRKPSNNNKPKNRPRKQKIETVVEKEVTPVVNTSDDGKNDILSPEVKNYLRHELRNISSRIDYHKKKIVELEKVYEQVQELTK